MEVRNLVVKISLSATFSLSLALPAAAKTFFVNSATGNDANNCTTKTTACQTIAAAKALIIARTDPSDSTLKLKGTFTENITFDDGDVTAPNVLDGLHITATDPDNKPTIDATGNDYGVRVTEINNVTIDHLIVSGSRIGISVAGYSSTYIDGPSIHHNQVLNLTPNPGFTGIELLLAKQAEVQHNSIHDLTIDTTDDATTTTSYGLYLYYIRNALITDNTIDDITTLNLMDTLTSSHYNYIYAVYGNTLINVTLRNNTVSDVTGSETSHLPDTTQTSTVYGMFLQAASDMTVTNNTIRNILAVTEAVGLNGTSSGNTAMGMYLSDFRSGVGNNLVQGNSIEEIYSTQFTDTGSAYAYGMRLDYLFSTLINNNTVITLLATAGGTIDSGSYSSNAFGLYGPFYGANNTVSNNTIKNLTANDEGTAANSSYYANVYGLYSLYSDALQVSDNTVRNLTWSMDDSGTDGSSKYGTIYGIAANYSAGLSLLRNTIRQLTATHDSTGLDSYLSSTTYGLATTYSEGVQVNNNTVRNLNTTATMADATNSETTYHSLYAVYLGNCSGAQITHNLVKNVVESTTQPDANSAYNTLFGYYLSASDGAFTSNKLLDTTLTNEASGGSAYNYFYGLSLSGLGQTIVDDNLFKNLTSTLSNAAATQYFYGIYASNGRPIYLNANQVRGNTVTSTGTQTAYGIGLNMDASEARVMNNVILGDSSFNGSGSYTGLQFTSDSTTDLDVINNTIADWRYPIEVYGGNQVVLLNNILSAITNTGYAIGIKYDHINRDNFRSDYNLLHNELGKDQAIYDIDNTSEIHLGDWSNTGGSYGYDLHSRYKPAGITATGRLRSTSKARGNGTADFNYTADSLEDTFIHTDINGNARPGANGTVDIGADEYQSS